MIRALRAFGLGALKLARVSLGFLRVSVPTHPKNMVVAGKYFTFLLIVVQWEIRTYLLKNIVCSPSTANHEKEKPKPDKNQGATKPKGKKHNKQIFKARAQPNWVGGVDTPLGKP